MGQDVNFPSQIKWFLKQQVQDFVWQKCTDQEKEKGFMFINVATFSWWYVVSHPTRWVGTLVVFVWRRREKSCKNPFWIYSCIYSMRSPPANETWNYSRWSWCLLEVPEAALLTVHSDTGILQAVAGGPWAGSSRRHMVCSAQMDLGITALSKGLPWGCCCLDTALFPLYSCTCDFFQILPLNKL